MRGIGQMPQDLEVGDEGVHLRQLSGCASESSHRRRFAVARDHPFGERRVGRGLPIGIDGCISNHVIGVGHTNRPQSLQVQTQIFSSQLRTLEPGIGWHHRLGYDVTWVLKMGDMPLV